MNKITIPFVGLLLTVLLSACMELPEVPPEFIDDGALPVADQSGDGASVDNSSGTDPANGESTAATESYPRPENLVLNEIYYDAPSADTDGEVFIELAGSPGGWLSAYQVRMVNGSDGSLTDVIELPDTAFVNDAGFFVIADGRTGALETTQVPQFDWIDNFDPQNGPDGMQLLDDNGMLVDSVVYGDGAVQLAEDGLILGEGSPAPDVGGGLSISRFPVGFDTDENSIDFLEGTPTPGEEYLPAEGL